MHHGKLSKLPGAWNASPETAIRYHVAPMKHLMATLSLREMACFPRQSVSVSIESLTIGRLQ